MKWSEVALWKDADTSDALNSFMKKFSVTQKAFSQVIPFIDVLKFMQKERFFKSLEVAIVSS